MNDEQQKAFLIDMLKTTIRDVIVYRTGIEYAKSNPDCSVQDLNDIMNLARNDLGVRTQLGDDFHAFVASALQLEEADAAQVLRAFVSEWSPRSAPN